LLVEREARTRVEAERDRAKVAADEGQSSGRQGSQWIPERRAVVMLAVSVQFVLWAVNAKTVQAVQTWTVIDL
jgi:hypothetical protein